MLMFAIVYFGVMIDVGLFDPIVRGILRFCKADPMRIVVGTALLAAIVSLDGDGSTTFMITVSAMYPLYKRLKMSLVVMTGVAATANGVMNTLPWGGPTARAATALKLDASDIFVPMIPALAVGLLFVFVLAYVLGRARAQAARRADPGRGRWWTETEAETETERSWSAPGAGGGGLPAGTGAAPAPAAPAPAPTPAAGAERPSDRRPTTTTASRASTRTAPPCAPSSTGSTPRSPSPCSPPMIMESLPIPVLFLLGAALALTVNFPHMPDQKARVAAHADNVLNVSGMVFAAAVFTGVLTGTGMVEHMAAGWSDGIPDGHGPAHGPRHRRARASRSPTSCRTTASTSASCRSSPRPAPRTASPRWRSPAPPSSARPLHMSSPLVPAVYVLVGMAKVEFGDHTRFTVKWAALTSLVVLGAGILFGII